MATRARFDPKRAYVAARDFIYGGVDFKPGDPFPPLDGWKILQAFMPREFAWEMKRFETRVGMIPLLCLMGIIFFFGTYILGPPYAFLMEMLAGRMPLR